jgi:hypothetical protein
MKVASVMAPVVGSDPISGHRYQGWTPCIKWCDEHCEGPWLFVSEGVFEFEWDSDYVLFMLRWA